MNKMAQASLKSELSDEENIFSEMVSLFGETVINVNREDDICLQGSNNAFPEECIYLGDQN